MLRTANGHRGEGGWPTCPSRAQQSILNHKAKTGSSPSLERGPWPPDVTLPLPSPRPASASTPPTVALEGGGQKRKGLVTSTWGKGLNTQRQTKVQTSDSPRRPVGGSVPQQSLLPKNDILEETLPHTHTASRIMGLWQK